VLLPVQPFHKLYGETVTRNIYFSNTLKHDSFASLLNEVHVEITISLQTSAEFVRHAQQQQQHENAARPNSNLESGLAGYDEARVWRQQYLSLIGEKAVPKCGS
jgi:hypothetical protein